MANQTRDNIQRWRKKKRKRRRLAILRLLVVLFLFGIVFSGVLFAGYKIYCWGSNAYQEMDSRYQKYQMQKDEKQNASRASFDGYTNLLILGVDDGVDRSGSDTKNADTIMVLSFENATGRVRILTIPGGTLVNLPNGSGQARISSLYAGGGPVFMTNEVSQFLGISIHQYIVLDMHVFAELVDILGGVDIYVENDMDYEDSEAGLSIHLKKGYQHLDGDLSQKYLRYRSNDLADVGRLHRQQKFVKEFYEKAVQVETVGKLPEIAEVFKHRMTTSAEIFDSVHLANVFYHVSEESPVTLILPGNPASGDEGVWIPDAAEIQKCMNELFPPDEGAEEKK